MYGGCKWTMVDQYYKDCEKLKITMVQLGNNMAAKQIREIGQIRN